MVWVRLAAAGYWWRTKHVKQNRWQNTSWYRNLQNVDMSFGFATHNTTQRHALTLQTHRHACFVILQKIVPTTDTLESTIHGHLHKDDTHKSLEACFSNSCGTVTWMWFFSWNTKRLGHIWDSNCTCLTCGKKMQLWFHRCLTFQTASCRFDITAQLNMYA